MKKDCPRGCGNKLDYKINGFDINPKSTIDGRRVCYDCFLGEIYARLSE